MLYKQLYCQSSRWNTISKKVVYKREREVIERNLVFKQSIPEKVLLRQLRTQFVYILWTIESQTNRQVVFYTNRQMQISYFRRSLENVESIDQFCESFFRIKLCFQELFCTESVLGQQVANLILNKSQKTLQFIFLIIFIVMNLLFRYKIEYMQIYYQICKQIFIFLYQYNVIYFGTDIGRQSQRITIYKQVNKYKNNLGIFCRFIILTLGFNLGQVLDFYLLLLLRNIINQNCLKQNYYYQIHFLVVIVYQFLAAD
eukprot:TRINITY_DN1573_c3_g1_i3.p3 TRINITY_DN1573_c3_g1~~TRINITY_DN1573_c3_g1_i3.p3  ORF type:complete len:257 (+),score=-13.28 TRINITY_DN1573_c3_g1_i3:181-951(+)